MAKAPQLHRTDPGAAARGRKSALVSGTKGSRRPLPKKVRTSTAAVKTRTVVEACKASDTAFFGLIPTEEDRKYSQNRWSMGRDLDHQSLLCLWDSLDFSISRMSMKVNEGRT